MKRFILSDLHIGFENSLYPEMQAAIDYILQKAEPGDEILGLGDWFHIKEEGLERCMKHEMTQKFRDLAKKVPTKLVLGNHDEDLEDYQRSRSSPNPISPIVIIDPFWENGFRYCHGHEFDYADRVFGWLPAFWDRFAKRKTPAQLMAEHVKFLASVYRVYSHALSTLPGAAEKQSQQCKGVVFGHTHLPVIQESPELPYLINDGDMRHSATFVLQDKDNGGFQLMRWDSNRKDWRVTSNLIVK